MELKIKRLSSMFFMSILVFWGSISLATPFLFNTTAYAADTKPVCMDGELIGDGVSSTVTIELNCMNTIKFQSSNTDTADSLDLTKIKLHPNDQYVNPFKAIILGDKLILTFYSSEGTLNRDITIDSGTILNSIDVSNDSMQILTEYIVDHNIPNIVEDSYFTNKGQVLIVSSKDGVLFNDIDNEGLVSGAFAEVNPTYGLLELAADGSFSYTAWDTFSGFDSFIYSALDAAGNSDTATVTINDASPDITGIFYRDGLPDQDKGYAKVGDTVRVDFNTSEPVTLDLMTIAGNDATYVLIDDNNFYIYYVMQEDDEEGLIKYGISAYDLVNNQVFYTSEDTIIFDKTKPEVFINGEDITIESGSKYFDEGAYWTDNVDNEGDVEDIYNPVNVRMPGLYKIKYSSTDRAGNIGIAYRSVIVIDTISPVISLNGDSVMTIYSGKKFIDPGAITDDGSTVTISGLVNTKVPGNYTLTYNSMDLSGNKAVTVYRTVIVKRSPHRQDDYVYGDVLGDSTFVDDGTPNEQGVLSDFDIKNVEKLDNSQYKPSQIIPDWYWWILFFTFAGVLGWRAVISIRNRKQ